MKVRIGMTIRVLLAVSLAGTVAFLSGSKSDCEPEPVGVVCSSNADCQAGEKCDPSTNSCVQRGKRDCNVDADCICGGIDLEDGSCFVGNVWYYQENVDQSQYCPDFCTGIAGHLTTKCVAGTCSLVMKEPTVGTDKHQYALGETVNFTFYPNALQVWQGGYASLYLWHIDKQTAAGWETLQSSMPFGCYVMDCVDGLASSICVDPGIFCTEVTEPVQGSWDQHHWLKVSEPCGGVDTEMTKQFPVEPGTYRVVYLYTENDQCTGEPQTAYAIFTIVE